MFDGFQGRHEHTVDAKGRLAIPAKFRETLVAQYEPLLIVTFWEDSLWAYPPQEWANVRQAVAKLPPLAPSTLWFQRVFIAQAEECPLDAQGRIQISQGLRGDAGIDRDVTVLGNLNRIEIWDRERFANYRRAAPDQFAATAEKLSLDGLRF